MLVQKYGYEKIITYTTRDPRENEKDCVDYHFITEEKFKEFKDECFFLETAEYNGWHYGSAVKPYIEDTNNKKVSIPTPHRLRQLYQFSYIIDFTSFYINVPRRDPKK